MSLPAFHHLPAFPYINTHHHSPHQLLHASVTHQARASTTAKPQACATLVTMTTPQMVATLVTTTTPQAVATLATTPTPQALAAPDTTPTPQARADIAVPAWPQAVAALTPTTTPPLPRYDLRTLATLPCLLCPGITTPTIITALWGTVATPIRIALGWPHLSTLPDTHQCGSCQ
ncbi:hypothetical protein Pcinc_007319 [Petrolisthes cinctipes]|uniref:Uncharacterized protein n=1 Tax=Petrolisthes cinctipes TaxID=88211 RepID=A0AAE1KY88_PETCI|nr:hypothetical protein Pcinc_007319 [Petrolisthes cinctipes]